MRKISKLNLINSVIIVFLFILFSFFYAKEYFLFHQNKSEIEKNIVKTSDLIKDFSLKNLRTFDDVEIYKTPDKELLKSIVKKIDLSKNRVYIEAYIFTEKDIKNALIKAKKRNIDVKVVLEKNVYMANNINKKTYEEFIKNWIDVVRSDSSDYSLNHSKFLIIDDEIILSTWNLSYSLFTKNRDFLLFIKDNLLLEKFLKNFEFDFTKNKDFVYDENLVLSPFYSREKIETLIKNAKKDIKIYFPYFEDEKVLSILEDKINDWVNIEIITDKKNENIDEIKSLGIQIKSLDKLTEHAKAIMIDNEYLYIWSINFSTYSLDKNKEIWILLIDENILSKFLEFFKYDFME